MHRATDRAPGSRPFATAAALLALLGLLGLASPSALAEAGRFLSVVGDVRVMNARGDVVRPERGAAVDAGDTVLTGSPALAQIRLTDGGLLSVRADTEMKLAEYAFAGGDDSAGRMFLELLRGGVRSITGLIGARNRSGYAVRTPHATIGIRGTDHITHVNLEPRPDLAVGTVDAVLQGGTFVQPLALPGGPRPPVLEVRPQQAGFVPADTRVPRLVPVPAFILPQPGELQVRAAPRGDAPAQPASRRDGADSADSPGAGRAALRRPGTPLAGDGVPKGEGRAATPLINPLVNPLTSPARAVTPGVRSTLPGLSTGARLPDTTRTLGPASTSPALPTAPRSLDPSATRLAPALTSPTTRTLSPTPTTISPTLTAPTTTLSPTITDTGRLPSPTTTDALKTISPSTTTTIIRK